MEIVVHWEGNTSERYDEQSNAIPRKAVVREDQERIAIGERVRVLSQLEHFI